MKKILATFLLAAMTASGQMQYIDLTTRTTNTTSSAAQISLAGGAYQPYATLNTNALTIGDPIPTAFAKVNSDFNYVSNEFGIMWAQIGTSGANYNFSSDFTISNGTNVALAATNFTAFTPTCILGTVYTNTLATRAFLTVTVLTSAGGTGMGVVFYTNSNVGYSNVVNLPTASTMQSLTIPLNSQATYSINTTGSPYISFTNAVLWGM